MVNENQISKPERNFLCDFSLETQIIDTNLPNLIVEKLRDISINPQPDKEYVIDVSFGVGIYKAKEFYLFPVERKQWEIDNLQKQKPEKVAYTIIDDVLSQQLHNICESLKEFNIPYHHAYIAGEDYDSINKVVFCIYETNATEKTKTEKKGTGITIAYSIIPHRPSIIKKMAEFMCKFTIEQIEKDRKKELELPNHTPNLMKAIDVFAILAKSIKEEKNEIDPEILTMQLISQAKIKNDWPLEIIGTGNTIPIEDRLDPESNIDIPDYLVFVKRKNIWSLNQVNNISVAKTIILSQGYNQKTVELVIVLHNMTPVHFNLYRENNGEIIPVEKGDAHMAKKLLLNWVDSQA